ncbi:hypothetical protein ACFLZ6_01460, partial [Nanoarchaeota archaeon]
MVLEKDKFRSDTGKELWKKYFGFMDRKKEQPKHLFMGSSSPSSDSSTQSGTAVAETSPRVAQPSSGSSILDQISNQFTDDAPAQPQAAEPATIDSKLGSVPQAAPVAYPIAPSGGKLTSSNSNLYDVVKYFRNKGVVGEEGLGVAITLALINRASFGVEGYSGSGKTFITDKLIELVEDKVYRIGQASKMAVFGEVDKINGSEIIYIPELQKAMRDRNSPIIEVIKDLTEGKDATRVVTKRGGKGTEEYRIKSGVSVIYTLALENHFKKDEESSRRLIRFRTDSSTEHLNEIHGDKARK